MTVKEKLGEMYVAFYSDSKERLRVNKERTIEFFRSKGAEIREEG